MCIYTYIVDIFITRSIVHKHKSYDTINSNYVLYKAYLSVTKWIWRAGIFMRRNQMQWKKNLFQELEKCVERLDIKAHSIGARNVCLIKVPSCKYVSIPLL